MASIELGPSHILTTLFKALTHTSASATELALLIVRRGAEHLTASTSHLPSPSSHSWKALYLRERLCDCLYYARHDYERSSSRQSLLHDQETFYGPHARNVLWTLMNVADDYLQLGQYSEAKSSYETALSRSQALSGFGKAKTRFAALEGLGRCVMADVRCEQANGGDEGVRSKIKVNEALRLFKEAESEARLWFDPSSRRIARVRDCIVEVEALLV